MSLLERVSGNTFPAFNNGNGTVDLVVDGRCQKVEVGEGPEGKLSVRFSDGSELPAEKRFVGIGGANYRLHFPHGA